MSDIENYKFLDDDIEHVNIDECVGVDSTPVIVLDVDRIFSRVFFSKEDVAAMAKHFGIIE